MIVILGLCSFSHNSTGSPANFGGSAGGLGFLLVVAYQSGEPVVVLDGFSKVTVAGSVVTSTCGEQTLLPVVISGRFYLRASWEANKYLFVRSCISIVRNRRPK